MHIVLGVISAVAGLIWAITALQRSGFDPASLNPFLWYRRSQWRKQYGTRPVFNLDDPLDVAAVLILGTAKCEGEISTEQKHSVQSIFENEFKLDRDAAADLLLASSHLIRDEIYLVDSLDKVLEKSSRRFTVVQARSLLAMMQKVGTIESGINEEQRKLILATEKYFEKVFAKQAGWANGVAG
ncbi:MAG: phenylacetic acid degradation protein [Gammaproteobacteria bacterium]|nr:phenylacetic acid degradation protein [Gammaproteobacteria bacterium]